jgi:hypothetical protein
MHGPLIDDNVSYKKLFLKKEERKQEQFIDVTQILKLKESLLDALSCDYKSFPSIFHFRSLPVVFAPSIHY